MSDKVASTTNSKGFTIIEVMIVLAIAAMIMLVVLLAVPAVQRSGRNTTIKNDASAIAAGITDYESNNNGVAPDTFTNTSGSVAITKTGYAGTASSAKVQGSTTTASGATMPPSTFTSAGAIYINTGHSCSTASPLALTSTIGTASSRSFAIYYNIETSGGVSLQCLDS